MTVRVGHIIPTAYVYLHMYIPNTERLVIMRELRAYTHRPSWYKGAPSRGADRHFPAKHYQQWTWNRKTCVVEQVCSALGSQKSIPNGVEKLVGWNKMEHPTSAVDQREEKIIIAEPVSPTSSPVPAIKLQRKYSSGWTLSNNGNTTSK